MSESSDDIPLGQRGILGTGVNLDSDSEGSKRSASPIPAWMSQHQTPKKSKCSFIELSSSDSDVQLVEDEADASGAAAGPSGHVAPEPAGPSQQTPKAGGRGKGKANSAAAVAKPVPATANLKGKAKAGGSEALEEAGPSGSQAVEAGAKVPPSTAGKAKVGVAAIPGELPVMLPEKLPANKVLVELEHVDGGATDLAGDSGAVGRFSVSGQPGQEDVHLDLKGVVYSTTLVPCASTLCIVNVGQTEAKVEAVLTQFVQLREVSGIRGGQNGAAGGLQDYFMFDDDDNYQLTQGAGEDPAGKGKGKRGQADDNPAPAKKRKTAAASRAGGKAKPAAKKKAGATKAKAKSKAVAKKRKN
ncbi:hypothetical protein WJX72_009943 [[Myrmecia] bisecta]|uniref:DNA-binding protein BIN4 n=1 Tax=[Myrmecia] bisecta TaxID=41462 RepID=A0AAW1R926_9CHLO